MYNTKRRPLALGHMWLWGTFGGALLGALYAGGLILLVAFADGGFGGTIMNPIEMLVAVAYGFMGFGIFGAIFGGIPGFILGFVDGVILMLLVRDVEPDSTRDELLKLQKRAVLIIAPVTFVGCYVVGFMFFFGEIMAAMFFVVLPSIIAAAMARVVVRRYFVKLATYTEMPQRKAKAKLKNDA